MRRLLTIFTIAVVGGFIGSLGTQYLNQEPNGNNNIKLTSNSGTYYGYAANSTNEPRHLNPSPESILPIDNFVLASEKSTSSVVFIQTMSEHEYRTGGWMDWFFEPRSSQRMGSGSGVVFSKDGYIVTNNHVIDEADKIAVIAGKRSYPATLVGRDPSSDLAVIKIESNDLPAIEIGNSKDVRVGEWVLAVGNPFNLTSTVTAGIVSAKGRNINILRDKFPIESFIQTDAAINPGNSGGALVNAQGELIGINTAILSRTGSYAGYGFAIPVNIAKKIFNDIVKHGEVQKAFVGAEFIDIDSELANRLEIEDLDGVIVSDILKSGAADKADLEKGDVLRKVNQMQVSSKADVEELIANSYPGEQLDLVVERNGKLTSRKLTLTNREGTTGILKRSTFSSEKLEVTLESVSKVERDLLGINSGVKVVDYKKNGFFAELSIPKGFIITQVNSRMIDEPEELAKILETIRGRFDIIGIDERGRKIYYPFRR
ncbi:MAG: trypsin-like peptidase domain-containing protein [Cyclobacteriaceae bacterium]